jgi:hypothetical protein
MKSHHLQIDKTNPALIINLHTKTVHKFNNEIVGRYSFGKVVLANAPELLTQQAGGSIVVATDAGTQSKSTSNYLGSSLDGSISPPLPPSSLSETVKLTEGYDLDKQQQSTKINAFPIRSSNVPKRNLFQRFSNMVKIDRGKFQKIFVEDLDPGKKSMGENNVKDSDEVDHDGEDSDDDVVDSDEDY